MPNIDDIINGAGGRSVADIQKWYWEIPSDEEYTMYTTIKPLLCY